MIVPSNVTEIAAGDYHSLFIKTDGSLWGMGGNWEGFLGDGTYNGTNRPELIVASNVVAVAAGAAHSLFIKTDGSLWAMGNNDYGQLGDGTYNQTNRPELIVSSNVVAIAAGIQHSLFLKTDGSLWAMGYNRWGALGDGTYSTNAPNYGINQPEQIIASNVTAVAAGGDFSFFLKRGGSLWDMGENDYGQLGNGMANPLPPYGTNQPQFIVASGVTAVSGGIEFSVFLKSDGSLWGMGENTAGQLGDGTLNNTDLPEEILTSGVKAVSSGSQHNLILMNDGSLWADGSNFNGQLGDGTYNQTNRPELIVGPSSGPSGPYTLTLIAQGSGTVQQNPTNATYPAGAVVTITANPNAGSYFANWSGGTNSTANPLNVIMNSDLVITGNFQAFSSTSGPTNRVSAPNEESLLAAIALGGWVGVPFNATITLTSPVTITNNVVLDGTGVAATLSGGNAVQLFYVAPGASLTLSNLTLANGNCVVTNGPADTPADGGAIYNDGGTVILAGCTVSNNQAQSMVSSGLARGGAIFNNGGTVLLYQSVIISNSVEGGVYPGTPGFQGNPAAGLAEGFGGALYSTNGTTTIIDCSISDNVSTNVCAYTGTGLTMGGALFQASGAMNITNSRFAGNQAGGGIGGQALGSWEPGSPAYGGAVAVTGGSLAIELSQFENNQADGAQGIIGTQGGGAGPASGGAIYCTGVCSLSDTTFAGNGAVAGNYYPGFPGTTGCGGGIYNDGTMVLNRCSVYGNWTQGGAVGIYSLGIPVGGSGLGGGIFNAAVLAATNCTIAQNSAIGAPAESLGGETITGNALGGGVYNGTNATAVFMNLSIAGNSCSSPLSLAGLGFSSTTNGVAAGSQIANTNGTLRLHNTIVAYGTNSNAYGPITDDGYNLCSDGSAAFSSGSSYNNTDPQLAPLGNYGGPTLCLALLATSPAIDRGDLNGCPTTDQRGYIRPFGASPDIGAYEYGSAASEIPYLNLSGTSGNLMLSFSAFPTNTYYLQSSTNLVTWINVSTNGPFAGGTYVSQPVSNQGLNHCFFRLLLK